LLYNLIDFIDRKTATIIAMANISIRQLQYLLALADTGSFSRAAERVGVTQSTLSAAISALENELGTLLIDRSSRRAGLLPAGEAIRAKAQEVVATVSAMPELVSDAGQPLTSKLRMGVIPSIAPFVLSRLIPSIGESYPELRLCLREGLTRWLIDGLQEGKLDVALIAHPYSLDGITGVSVGKDPFLLAVKSGHPLAGRKRVSAKDLEHEHILLLESGHCLRNHVISAVGPIQGQDDVLATSLITLVQMVDFGLGATLLPSIAAKAGVTRGTDIVLVPYDGPNSYRTLMLVWRQGSARADEYSQLAEHIRSKPLKTLLPAPSVT